MGPNLTLYTAKRHAGIDKPTKIIPCGTAVDRLTFEEGLDKDLCWNLCTLFPKRGRRDVDLDVAALANDSMVENERSLLKAG